MNWFERHLNWTMGLTWIFVPLIIAIFVTMAETWPTATTVIPFFIFTYVVAPVATFWITGWAIKKKGRSLWNLLWLIVPFGFIVLLCLENRATPKYEHIEGHIG